MACAPERQEPPPRPPPPRPSQRTLTAPSESESSVPNSLSDVKSYSDLKGLRDSIYKFVDSALQADEGGNKALAFQNYSEGHRLLEMALRVNCERLQDCGGGRMDQAKLMIQKMNKTRQEVTFRLQELQGYAAEEAQQQMQMEADAPPSYDEAMSEGPSSLPGMDEEMMRLGDSIFAGEASGERVSHGTNLFSIPDGVQIFYINPEGLVSAPSYPSSLNIVRFTGGEATSQHSGAPPAFLHVGDWMYPLIPGASPALRTNYGAYLFPDVMSQQLGSAVGLMLPEGLAEGERSRFEQLIQSFTVMEQQGGPLSQPAEAQEPATAPPYPCQEEQQTTEKQREEERGDTASKISHGIVTAAEWIAWGVGKGAEKAGELIKAGSEKFRERTSPGTSERHVDPRVQKGVVYARQATNATVKVTGFIVNKLGEATMSLARQLAPHVRRQGEKYVPKSLSKPNSEGGKSTLDGIVEVAASGLKGFGTVYIGLETAAKSLGKSLANETVQVVQHKYGNQVGQLTENSMYAAGNAVLTAYNANHIGVKAVAKRAAKDTGKAVLEDLNNSRGQTQTGGMKDEKRTPEQGTEKKHT
ncbi:spartin [Aplysia californica]|uniref:Spartin n=1 Tax=Aplysia californica TaxID=6500 RepID=A0ABM0JDG1_APLCA|nr:spartin [Aplysia californica]XP_005091171.1 spartin [Aplysia californica]